MLICSGHQFLTSILYITRLLKTNDSCYQSQYSIETPNIYPVTSLFFKEQITSLSWTHNKILFFHRG